MINPRSCAGIGVLIATPLLLVALVVGMVLSAETLSTGQFVLFPGLGLFLFSGWLLGLSTHLPARIGQGVNCASLVLISIATFWTGAGTIWFGNEMLNAGQDPGKALLMIGAGVVLLGVGALLVFRNRLPWNRGDSLQSERAKNLRRQPARVRLRNHLGETRALSLDRSVSAVKMSNGRGHTVASRFAGVLDDARLLAAVEVVQPGATISSWDLLATELSSGATVTLRVPRGEDRVRELWDAAEPERN